MSTLIQTVCDKTKQKQNRMPVKCHPGALELAFKHIIILTALFIDHMCFPACMSLWNRKSILNIFNMLWNLWLKKIVEQLEHLPRAVCFSTSICISYCNGSELCLLLLQSALEDKYMCVKSHYYLIWCDSVFLAVFVFGLLMAYMHY